jgi:hypothetical protein
MRIVQPHELAETWGKVRRWIEEAIEYGQGDEDADDVLIGLARGIYCLWYEPDEFAGVVQVFRHPRQTVATVLYAGGESNVLVKMKAAILKDGIEWCRSNGIGCIRVYGREGWERVLGIPRKGIVMQLDLRVQGGLQ